MYDARCNIKKSECRTELCLEEGFSLFCFLEYSTEVFILRTFFIYPSIYTMDTR